MRYVSMLMPVLESQDDEAQVRKALLDLLAMVNTVDSAMQDISAVLVGAKAVGLPTVAPAAGSGVLWNDGGTVKVA